ncbi:FecR domain-containing protein [Mesorhizobium sp. SB112]|uniref:FecR family protein n=1 Tax=Mesorhizobium sp. SB112 TaxID=3151853 RepID=UPI003267C795
MTMEESDREAVDLTEAAVRWIARLHSGTATQADRQAWRKWRATSPAHEKAAVEAERLWSDISDLHVDPATGLVKPGRKPPSVSRRAVLTGIGGVAVAGAAGGTLWSSGVFTRILADHATPVASTSLIELPDGSRVTLNARSAIDVAFGPDSRGISLLQGQAFFEIAGGPSRPFEVVAGDVSIRSHAAAFDVTRNLPHGGIEIAVAVDTARILPPQTPSIDLMAGEIVAVDGSGRIGTVRAQNAADTGAWRDGIYRANARTLEEVVAALSAWYGGSIVIAGRGLHALRVDAVLDLRDPRGSLDALQGGLPIRVRHVANFITVISAA